MLLEEGLFAYLAAHSDVSSRVGRRIYPLILPQNPTYPSLTYFRVFGEHPHSMQGSAGLAISRMQISAWSPDYAEAKATAEAVRMALQGYQGRMGDVRVGAAIYEGDRDLYDADAGVHHIAMDFRTFHEEPKPRR